MEIKAATKFLGNSEFKQLCHITSELIEVWVAWVMYKLGLSTKDTLAKELIDLQGSPQTMLEGPLEYQDFHIDYLRKMVVMKNNQRGYYQSK